MLGEKIRNPERRLILHYSSLKIFYVLLYRRSSILQDIYFFYRIRRSASELIAHAFINTRNSRVWIRKNYVIGRKQKRNEHGASFQSSPKINCMLITRLICIKWKFTAPGQKKHSHIHHTRPPPNPQPPPPPPPPHFAAHTRQKKRNAWVSQLKQAWLTSKNKKVDIFPLTLLPLMSHPYLLHTNWCIFLLVCAARFSRSSCATSPRWIIQLLKLIKETLAFLQVKRKPTDLWP